ncbi:hypothetical protein OPT61_g6653 [Boeremia exigua]|uniref:Uncharacterized protein n=1 Tax=Boeremia exigua TaxID=749465 RepID=A0ACC2I637_9PLEO|nr:hypothetical protein OPT61_g6653 [Boeremia exigua]
MIALLRDLRSQVSNERRTRIDDLLASAAEDIADAAATVGDPIDKYRGPIGEGGRGEVGASAEVGSSGEQGVLDEDLMRDEETSVAGFIGKASEIQWMRKLHRVDPANTNAEGSWSPLDADEAVDGRLNTHWKRHSNHATKPLISINKMSFYLDDDVFEPELLVDPLEMPPFEIAEKLVQAYMQSVQNSFPFLAEKTFVNRFYQYYASLQHGTPYSVSRKWQATLNMVFAIGAVYSQLIKADWQADDRDHLIYHSRAWSLSTQDPWGFSNPDLPYVQVTGLLSFYYLSIGHINRSWLLIGSATRAGFALGMHLRNEDDTTSDTKKELNSRIWWAHYSLERLVSTLTGRPSLGMGYLCSVPLPLPLASEDIEDSIIASRIGDKGKRSLTSQEINATPQAQNLLPQQDYSYANGPETANSGSYLKSIVNLGEITLVALELYGASTAKESWESVQRMIAHQSDKLDAWATALPEGLNFFRRLSVARPRYLREQNTLALLYHSTRMLITRPCLCRLDRRISNQTASSDTFNQRAALICVEAAKSVATLLPAATPENLASLYEAGPWWQIVQLIMQALVVLCLEIVLQAQSNSDDRQGLVPSLKSLMRWLRTMRVNNNIAVRAYSISVGLLKKTMSVTRIDLRDLFSDDDGMDTSTGPSPASSTPAQTHTPYPNVLNPVDEPHNGKTSTPARDLQHHSRFQDVPRTQYPESTTHQKLKSTQPKSFYQPPNLADHDSNLHLDAYDDRFSASSGLDQTIFPGWIVTSFDEHKWWTGFGSGTTSFGVS